MKEMMTEKALTKYTFKISFNTNSLWYSREIRMRLAAKKKTGPLLNDASYKRSANSLWYSREIRMRLAAKEKTGPLLSDASHIRLEKKLKTFLRPGILNWEGQKYNTSFTYNSHIYNTLKPKKSNQGKIKSKHNA